MVPPCNEGASRLLASLLLVLAVLPRASGQCGPQDSPSSVCTPTDGPFWTNGSVIDLDACGLPAPYSAPGCSASTCTYERSCQNCYYEAQGCERDCFRQPYNSLLDHLPTEHRSQGGVLEVDLHVDACYHLLSLPVVYDGCSTPSSEDRGLGTVGMWGWCINGGIPGPNLIVKPGERLIINLYNDLGAEMAQAKWDFNQPGRFNSTNLHVHGLYVSPLPSSDHVLVHVGPGEMYSYVYDIPPWHPTGSYWYHPHRHNSADTQVALWLHGFILIEEPDEMGVLTRMPTVPLIFTQMLNFFTEGSGKTMASQMAAHGLDPRTGFNPALLCGGGNQSLPDQSFAPGFRQAFYCDNYTSTLYTGYTISSGMTMPKVSLVSNIWYRFRMLNAGNGETQVLWGLGGVYPSELGCEVWVVARDGVTLRYPRNIEDFYISKDKPYSFFNLLVTGARYDFAMRCVYSDKNSRGFKLSIVRGQEDSRDPTSGEAKRFFPGIGTSDNPIAWIEVLREDQGVEERCASGALRQAQARTPYSWRKRHGAPRLPPWSECTMLRSQQRNPFDITAATTLGPDLGWRFAPTKDDPVSGEFTANFSSVATPYNQAWGYQQMKPQPTPPPNANNLSITFNVNGYSFSTTHVMHRAAIDTTEQWTVQSTDYLAFHIFHVHTWHFQIMRYQLTDGLPWFDDASVPADLDDFWFDVVGLATQNQNDCAPGSQRVDCNGYRRAFDLAGPGGSALIRIRFFEFTGELIFHCHVLTHEDAGMMAYTTVGNGTDASAGVLTRVPNFFSYEWRSGPCSDGLGKATCNTHVAERRCWQRDIALGCARTCGLCTQASWHTRDKKTAFYLTDTTDPAGADGAAVGLVNASGTSPRALPYTVLLTSPSQLLMAPGTAEYAESVLNPPLSSKLPWGASWTLGALKRLVRGEALAGADPPSRAERIAAGGLVLLAVAAAAAASVALGRALRKAAATRAGAPAPDLADDEHDERQGLRGGELDIELEGARPRML